MKSIINKPHLFFLLAIPIIMLVGIFSENSTLDINIHDTYYIFSYLHLATLISILFGIIGIGYWIMLKADRKLSKWLNFTHILTTIGGLILVLIISQLYRESKTDKILADFQFNQNLDITIFIILVTVIFGQIIYPINIIRAIINKRNKTSG